MLNHLRKTEPNGRIPWNELRGSASVARAVVNGFAECVKILLVFGVLNDDEDPDHGVNLLKHAIYTDQADIAIMIMTVGKVDVQATRMHRQAGDTVDGRVQLLKESPAMMDAACAGTSAVMDAAWAGLHSVVEFCIKKGADIEAVNPHGETALLLAAEGCVHVIVL